MGRFALAVAAFLFSLGAAAQEYAGTWTATNSSGAVITLTLEQPGPGAVLGILEGNGHKFEVEAEVRADGILGTVSSEQAMVFIGGRLHPTGLLIELMEPGPDGQPNQQTARHIRFSRSKAQGK
jgi:hypothetical protein